MSIEYRIAQQADLEKIYEFAHQILQKEYPDQMECMIKLWESRFRKEALEHYLKLGWSFTAVDQVSGKLCGFFLGQPLLFFEGQTQTLWVEEVMSENSVISAELMEIAYRLSRDKHFQKVIFPSKAADALNVKSIKYNEYTSELIWSKTTK